MAKTDVQRFLPMKPVHHMILLLLQEAPAHGVALLERLESVSKGAVRLNAGSLYRTIARLVDDGLIVQADSDVSFSVGAPRKVYRVTPLGREVVEAESLRQAELVELAGKLNLIRRRS